MRKLIYIFVSITALSVLGACDAMDMDDVEPADMGLVDEVFFDAVTPFNRALELADFYFRYRNFHNDNDFVNELKLEYFGETVPFVKYGDDGIEVEWWGTVTPTEDEDVYIVTLDPHWMGSGTAYTVSVTGYRAYNIEYNSSENDLLTVSKGFKLSLVSDVHIMGHYAYADMFSLIYEDSGGAFEVRVHAGGDDEMVKFSLCRAGEFMYYPVSGAFYWAVSGSVLKNFKIVFHEGYFEFIEAEEISAEFTAVP